MPRRVESYEEAYDGVERRTEHGVYLRKYHQSKGTQYPFRLTSCPACGEPIEPNEQPGAHIAEHSPEEFGL